MLERLTNTASSCFENQPKACTNLRSVYALKKTKQKSLNFVQEDCESGVLAFSHPPHPSQGRKSPRGASPTSLPGLRRLTQFGEVGDTLTQQSWQEKLSSRTRWWESHGSVSLSCSCGQGWRIPDRSCVRERQRLSGHRPFAQSG